MVSLKQLQPKKRLFVLGIAAGLLVLIATVIFRSKPPLVESAGNAVDVDVLVVTPQQVAPTIEGFGRVEPKTIWQAIAEVSGRVVYRHPDLYKGKMLKQGTVLLQIDKTDYEISLAEAEADHQAIQVQLEGKTLQETNLSLSLQIERERLTLAEQELARKQKLKKQKLVSQSEVDLESQNLLQQRQKVQELDNQLILLPNETELLQAQLKQAAARVAEAARKLEKTTITLPFTARIANVTAELDQVVSAQQELITAHGMQLMTVHSQVSIHDMRTLVGSLNFEPGESGLRKVTELGMTAELILEGWDFNFRWPASVDRISETIDPSQATVGIFLEVEQIWQEIEPGVKPPLVNGMFLRAEISGQPKPHWLLPKKALHGNKIYLLDEQNKLRIIPARLQFFHDQDVAVAAELKAGDKVVLTDLLPAVPGMALQPLNVEVQK
ncbi:efflux RND transporter periplasmic adaptor subunit [Corallincola platygyrae]|uniref:Efflux RND transporter periplasmic adaptor subunit n=1 Tax=Corallincola platygyrae TaxID=1193278 RepID=A0ABW4XTV7_9GAMM